MIFIFFFLVEFCSFLFGGYEDELGNCLEDWFVVGRDLLILCCVIMVIDILGVFVLLRVWLFEICG